MGKRKGSWRKFFCCAGPPETQSSTCVNINVSGPAKPPPEPEFEQDDEDLYIEAEVQTSNVEIPEGNRWRWSRLHNEVEVQTSSVSLPTEKAESLSEMDAQMQTSFLSLPREAEAQAQTSFLSLRSLAPFETEAQVQTSFAELPRESCAEAEVQTSLLSLPQEREAQVQTSFPSLPEKPSRISIQGQPSYLEVLEKIASLPLLVETQVQTSDLEMPPSEADIQIQTSFSDYMSEKEETSSIETEQQSKRSSSQLSEMDFCTLYPLYIDAEAQTLPVEIPPGNDWRSARLKAATQIQTSNISLENPVPLSQGVIQVQPSRLTLEKPEMLAKELEAPLTIKKKHPPSIPVEIGIQRSSPEIQGEDKQSLLQQSNAQVQPSTIELLKKLSLLSQIETVESASRTELLKKVSSLSVTDPYMQTSGYELQRKPSSLSDSATQGQVLNTELLNTQPSSAQVMSSDYEETEKLCLRSLPREVQTQTSDLELMKQLLSSSHTEWQGRTSDADLHKCSSLSLVEAMDGNQEEVTEGREYLITPQLMEAQIRKWYHEFPEVQTASQAPVQREPLLSPTVDREAQTSSVEIPQGNRWRASRLQADAEAQTSRLESAVEEVKPCHQTWNDTQTQTSLLEIWQAKGLADAQIQTSNLGLARTEVEHAPPLVIDSQVQTSLVDLGKANGKADVQTQTSVDELPKQMIEPSAQQIDRLAQTSFLETYKAKEPDSVEQKSPEFLEPKEENFPLQTDLEIQTSLTDIWRGKDKTDVWEQTSLLEIPDTQEELPLSPKTDAVVQTSDVEIPMGSRWRSSRLHADVQLQTSMLDMKEEELEPSPASQINTPVQTSLLDIWKTKDLRDAQAQTSQMDVSPSLEELPLPSQLENVVQSPAPGTAESSPPSQIDTEVQTSFLDLAKTKDVSDSLAQTSQLDMSKSVEEPENVVQSPAPGTAESSPPSQIDIEVQTSFLDLAKTKNVSDSVAQTSQLDMSKSVEEPLFPPHPENVVQSPAPGTSESPPPSQIDTEVQTSFLDLVKTKDVSDSLAQTSQLDMSKSVEEPENVVQSPAPGTAESSPPSQIDTEVQTSFLDLVKTKDVSDSLAQTSQLDMSKSVEELLSHPENVVQSPTPETAESALLSQVDTEVQTSFLDLAKTKDVSDSVTQTSQLDMSKSVEEPENVVQSPAPGTAESPPPSQIDTEVQTSFLDLSKTKDVSDSLAQTSQLDMSKSVEELLLSHPENVVQPPAPETAESALLSQVDTEAQTSFFDIWRAKELSDGQIQTSWGDLPTSMEEPLPHSQPESLMQIATTEPPSPNELSPEKQTSLLEMWKAREPVESFELPRSSPSGTDTKVQASQLAMQSLEERLRAQVLPSGMDVGGATLESTVPSRTASPACLSIPGNMEADLLEQAGPPQPTSLLEVWTTRQEAEVQMQTANLGISFDKDSPLFPILLESQEEKKLEQISKVEGKSKPPIFTEAQVQTSFAEIPRGKKWRTLCTEAQVQTSFPDLRSKDRMPALQKMVSDHVSAKRVQKGPKRATPVSVHLHVKMSPKHRTSNEKK